MSVEAMTWALKQKTGTTARKAVLLALADRAGFDWGCWPSQALIATETEMTERNVRRVLVDLEEAGLITREARYREGHRITDFIVLTGQSVRHESEPYRTSETVIPDNGDSSYRTPVSGEPSVEPSVEPRTPLPPASAHLERFWTKVDRESEAPCWTWTGGRSEKGYGIFSVDNKNHRAHRWLLEQISGDLGDLQVHHTCNNTACVNPEHLDALSGPDHAAIRREAATACAQGHPLEGTNLYISPGGIRRCRSCYRNWWNQKYSPAKSASGGGELTVISTAPFDEWYSLYPRKEARRAAEKAYWAALKRATAEEIRDGLKRSMIKWKMDGTERRYIPLPASWLNANRWMDEIVLNGSEGKDAMIDRVRQKDALAKQMGIERQPGEDPITFFGRKMAALQKLETAVNERMSNDRG